MVAFVFSLLVTFAGAGAVHLYARRRRAGMPLTWGEALAGALFAFALMFLAYGIMPHQWLTYADNQLQWRKDKILFGPGRIIHNVLPFTVTYEAIRDLIATGLYIVGLGAQIPTPEWGSMLSAERNQVFTAPFLVFFPGLAIMVNVLSFNLIGDGLRDAAGHHGDERRAQRRDPGRIAGDGCRHDD